MCVFSQCLCFCISFDFCFSMLDLLESGKARMRNYTDPGKVSQSPRVQRSSPLHRPPTDAPPSSQSRTAHTLPHQSTSSTTSSKEESVLERRFTFPTRRSAFTPVTPPEQSQTTPISKTNTLTNSHHLIPNGGSPSAATETGVIGTVAETTQSINTSLDVTTVTTTTPSHITPSTQITSHTSQPYSTSDPNSTISIISSSDLHTHHIPSSSTSTTSTRSLYHHHHHPHPSHVAKPTPSYAVSSPYLPQHQFITDIPLSHNMTHTTHIHHSTSATPPPSHNRSGKTTPIGEFSYTIPLTVGPTIVPIFNPIVIGYGSPIHSPSPSPLTPGGLRGKSSSNIARTPTDFDSLNRWLKSHRLHKYASIFENMAFDEVMSLILYFLALIVLIVCLPWYSLMSRVCIYME